MGNLVYGSMGISELLITGSVMRFKKRRGNYLVLWPVFWLRHLFFWNWAVGVACIFLRLTNTWKDAQHHSLSEKCKSKPLWGTISRQSEWLRAKSLQAINAGEGVEKQEPSYTVGGNPPHFKSHVLFSEMPQETTYTLMHTQHPQFPSVFRQSQSR